MHIGECRQAGDIFAFADCLINSGFFGLVDIRVVCRVETGDLGRSTPNPQYARIHDFGVRCVCLIGDVSADQVTGEPFGAMALLTGFPSRTEAGNRFKNRPARSCGLLLFQKATVITLLNLCPDDRLVCANTVDG